MLFSAKNVRIVASNMLFKTKNTLSSVENGSSNAEFEFKGGSGSGTKILKACYLVI